MKLELVSAGLEQLHPLKQTLFSLCIADRLFPHYVRFVYETQWGDSDELQEILDDLWQSLLSTRPISSGQIYLDRVLALAPDDDMAWAETKAQYACQAAWCAVNSVVHPSVENALASAEAAWVAACDYDIETEESEPFDQPAVRAELETQKNLIARLDREPERLDSSSIEQIRAETRAEP